MYNAKFKTKEDYFKHLKDNKEILIAEKKITIKYSDVTSFMPIINKNITKAADGDLNKITIKVVINTTNILDSHDDVHMRGIWNKTLKDKRKIYLLQEHQMTFDHIISSKVEPSVVSMKWAELGIDFKGETQALIFDAEIEKQRNDYMFDQYLKGYVDNHSVGMQYVNMFLCIDSEDRYFSEEKENWDKYIEEVVNENEAINQGYFYAVTEAKLIEGSAVPIGSNYATPTLEVTENKSDEPPTGTHKTETEEAAICTYSMDYVLDALKHKI
jgi:hypothetical protein